MSDPVRMLTDLGKTGTAGSLCDVRRPGGDVEGVTEAGGVAPSRSTLVCSDPRCTVSAKDGAILQKWGRARGWGLGQGSRVMSWDLDCSLDGLRSRFSWPTGSMAPQARPWAQRAWRGRDLGHDPCGGFCSKPPGLRFLYV